MSWIEDEVEALARGEIFRRVEWRTRQIAELELEALSASPARSADIRNQVADHRQKRLATQSRRSWRFFRAHWAAQLCRWSGRRSRCC